MIKNPNNFTDFSSITSVSLRCKIPKNSSSPRYPVSMPNTSAGQYLDILNQLNGQCRDILHLQLLFGLRSCEALNIKNGDFLPNGLLTIASRKGSNQRWVFCPFLEAYRLPSNTDPNRKLFNISYFSYYRVLRRAGIYFKKNISNKYFTVSHTGRAYVLRLIDEQPDTTLSALMAFSGHKSTNGILYYLTRKKCRNF